jgi:hypothetical protein
MAKNISHSAEHSIPTPWPPVGTTRREFDSWIALRLRDGRGARLDIFVQEIFYTAFEIGQLFEHFVLPQFQIFQKSPFTHGRWIHGGIVAGSVSVSPLNRPGANSHFGLNASKRPGKIGVFAKDCPLRRRGIMPEPDYNAGDPPGFWPWFIALTLALALALWYAACS